MKRKSFLSLLLFFIFSVAGLNYLLKLNIIHRVYPSDTPSPTITPPVDEGLRATTFTDTNCFDWSFKTLASVDANEIIHVLGRNRDATWFYVRWPKFTTTCWVSADRIKPQNYRPIDVFFIHESFPPSPTITPTIIPDNNALTTSVVSSTSTTTHTPTATKTYSLKTNTPTKTKDNSQTNPNHTSTITPTPTTTFTPTRTSTFTPTPTSTSTNTSTPTPTPTDTLTPVCNKPSTAPKLSAGNNGPNVNLSWSSVQGATSYEVFVSANDGSAISLGTTNKTNMGHSIPKDTKHVYYVVPINSCGDGPDSNIEVVSR